MKNLALCLLVLVMLLTFSQPALAVVKETPDSVAQGLDFSQVDEFIDQLDDEVRSASGFSLRELWQLAKDGKVELSAGELGRALVNTVAGELLSSGVLLGQLVVLAACFLLLNNLQSSFGSGSVSTLSNGVIYLVLISLALHSFNMVQEMVLGAVNDMSGFLYALLPILLTLFAALGGISTVGLFHPMLFTFISIAMNVVRVVILPLLYFGAVLGIVSYISPRFKVDKLAKLCRDIGLGLMMIMMSLFIAVLGMVGVAGAAMDGLTIKAAKSAGGLFIPIVGKSLADALDAVLGTSLLLKNSIGIVGVLVILVICIFPAVKVLMVALVYRLAAALIQPLGAGSLTDALGSLAASLTAFFAVLAVCGLFFFFILSITIGMGNITMMMR